MKKFEKRNFHNLVRHQCKILRIHYKNRHQFVDMNWNRIQSEDKNLFESDKHKDQVGAAVH